MELNNSIECIAIDNWLGDKQTGSYSEDVFETYEIILSREYLNVGKYIRKSFDEANDQFEDGSIDLLHIDGLHTYQAVSRDFNNWKGKMSDLGIIMLHDTQEFGESFGVWKLWREIRDSYPSFEFEHSHGLGVLLIGANPGLKIHNLFEMFQQHRYELFIKTYYSNIGDLSPINYEEPVTVTKAL